MAAPIPNLWAQTQPLLGDGSDNNPYQINTLQEFLWFMHPDNPDESICSSAILMQDIDLGSYCHPTDEAKGISQVSWKASDFIYGTLDGNGKTISNLYINEPEGSYAGLFSVIDNQCIVENLTVNGCITTGDMSGMIAGINYGTILNCQASGSLTGRNSLGGITGTCIGTICQCNNYASIFGEGSEIGGIAGRTESNSSIDDDPANLSEVNPPLTDCFNYGNVSASCEPGEGKIGGIVGYSKKPILRCGNFEIVSGFGSYIGGITGMNEEPITDCINVSSISGGDYIGGLSGIVYHTSISNCFSMGEVSSYWGKGGLLMGAYWRDDTDNNSYLYYKTGTRVYSDYEYHTDLVQGTGDAIAIPAIGVTDEDIASGSLAYRLELHAFVSNTWGQEITSASTNPYPVLGGAKVYSTHSLCDGTPYADATFTNDATLALTDAHQFDEANTHTAVAPTCTSDGNIAYSECTQCHQRFDQEGNLIDDVIDHGGHTPDPNGTCTRCHLRLNTQGWGDFSSSNPYEGQNNESLSISRYSGGMDGYITEIAFNVIATGELPTQELKIYMAKGDFGLLYSYDDIKDAQFTLVYSGNPTLGTRLGWETLTLDTPFLSEASSHLLIAIYRKSDQCNSKLRYSQIYYSPQYLVATGGYDLEHPASIPNWYSSNTRPDIRLSFSPDLDTFSLTDATTYCMGAEGTAADFFYSRTFEDTNWTTWYVPFQLTLTEQLCSKFAFSRINNVHQYDDDDDGEADRTVIESFRQKPGKTLKANYPYLVKAIDANSLQMDLSLSDITLAASKAESISCQSVDYVYTFTGTYIEMGDSGNTHLSPYTLFNDGEWYHFKNLMPQRHYLTITPRQGSSASQAPERISLNVIGDEEISGIVTLYGDDNRQSSTYDLLGRRINNSNLRSGLRIENGRFFISK